MAEFHIGQIDILFGDYRLYKWPWLHLYTMGTFLVSALSFSKHHNKTNPRPHCLSAITISVITKTGAANH